MPKMSVQVKKKVSTRRESNPHAAPCKEVSEKYSDKLLTFSGYWKYTFTYAYHDVVNNISVVATYGGNAEQIYKYEVTTGGKLLGVYLDGWAMGWDSVRVIHPDGTEDLYI